MRANEDSEDGQDTDEGDIEAPYLAPKQTPVPKPSQDEPTAQAPSEGKNPPAEDSQDSSGEESIPELINLREGEDVPPPSLSLIYHCPRVISVVGVSFLIDRGNQQLTSQNIFDQFLVRLD